ncbi:MAG: rhodanese-like domain-containing protein [Deltaproteobacteria bacterium]|nr:rhodanese-like domain-containing protein [Deltaproteobacteria bacterium]
MPQLITAPELAARMKKEKVYLLDVREPWEAERASIAGTSALLPLTTWPHAVEKVKAEKGQPIVVYCHHGVRSFRAAQALEQMGYAGVLSLTGGIDAWSREVEPEVTRY